MKLALLAFCLACVATAHPTSAPLIPETMRGHWLVVKNLSERSLGCFDPEHARALIGLRLVIREQRLMWNGLASEALAPEPVQMTSDIFQARFGKRPQELGLTSAPITLVNVRPSEGVPVNALTLVDRSTLLIDACNIWLQAWREDDSLNH